jgi:hypothetical protein
MSFASMSVNELREELVKYGFSKEEADNIKGKSNLVYELQKAGYKSEQLDSIEIFAIDEQPTEKLELVNNISEKEEKNIMTRMPRDPHKPLFGYSEMAVSFIKGLAVLAATLFVYGWAITQFNAEVSRALMFVSLVCGNLSLIVANLSWNKSYLRIILFDSLVSKAVMGGAILFLWLSLNISFFKPLFHFETPPLLESIAAGAIGFFSVWLVVSVLKSPSVFRRSFLRP